MISNLRDTLYDLAMDAMNEVAPYNVYKDEDAKKSAERIVDVYMKNIEDNGYFS